MKNFKYIAILLTFTLFMGCGEDDVDSITNDGTYSPTSEISIVFTDINDEQIVTEDGGTISFTISSSLNLNTDIEVALGVTASSGSTQSITFPATVTIPAGSVNVQVDIAFADDGLDEGFESELVTLDILSADFGESSEYYLTTADSQRNIFVIDSAPSIVTTPGDITITVSWADLFKDLDIFLVTGDQDLSGNVIDSSQGITTTEVVVLPQSEFGLFSVYMYEYYFNYPADYELVVTFPDGQEVSYTRNITEDGFTIVINKQPFGTNVACEIIEL